MTETPRWPEWQPIETMPKDGREVLLYWPNIGMAVWPAKEDVWEGVTHWLPLPPAPEE